MLIMRRWAMLILWTALLRRLREEIEMKYWFDTEFIEDGRTIDLMSIGIVSEDGREYYAESSSCDLERANEWVKSNVIAHLRGPRKDRNTIRAEILSFVGSDRPELWAWYADYDWVALCQLFGTMMDLPKGWPMYCRDAKQLADEIGNPELPKQESGEHHALSDARHNKLCWGFLNDLRASSARGKSK